MPSGIVSTATSSRWTPCSLLPARARLSPNRSPATALDDLPAFSVLQTDDERERKAETQRPGTFGVVVTPESFMDLPEYAATVDPQGRRASIQSQSSLGGFPSLSRSVSRVRTQPDPNTVVLDRFEDVSPASASPFGVSPSTRRPSLPESMWQLALTTPSPSTTGRRPTAPFTPATRSEHSGVTRFRHYILRILVQPEEDNTSSNTIVQGSTRDTFEVKALQFPPVGTYIA